MRQHSEMRKVSYMVPAQITHGPARAYETRHGHGATEEDALRDRRSLVLRFHGGHESIRFMSPHVKLFRR